MNITAIILKDVEGFWGGQNIFLQRTGDATIQVVDRTMQEQRYHLLPNESDWQELTQIVSDHNLLNTEIPDRMGVPGEAQAELLITTDHTKKKLLVKWANDKHAGFDALYKTLLQLIPRAKTSTPIFTGPYDHTFQPTNA